MTNVQIVLMASQAVGSWLVRLLTPSTPSMLSPTMLVAILNAIIDIYADEAREYDGPVFVQGGFTETLTELVGRIRNEVSRFCRRDV